MANLRSEIFLFLVFSLAVKCDLACKDKKIYDFNFQGVNKLVKQEQCNVPAYRRIDCGYGGITKERCERQGCCFDDSTRGTIFCHYLNTAKKGVCILMNAVHDGYVTEDEMKTSGVNYKDVAFFDLTGDQKFNKEDCFALQMVVESNRSKFIINWFKYYDENCDGKLTKEELIQGDPNGQDPTVQKKITSVLKWVGDLNDSDASTLDFIEFYQAYRQGPDNQQLYRPASV